nr:hypothetical protein CFP56_11782 [Quercus suber]
MMLSDHLLYSWKMVLDSRCLLCSDMCETQRGEDFANSFNFAAANSNGDDNSKAIKADSEVQVPAAPADPISNPVVGQAGTDPKEAAPESPKLESKDNIEILGGSAPKEPAALEADDNAAAVVPAKLVVEAGDSPPVIEQKEPIPADQGSAKQQANAEKVADAVIAAAAAAAEKEAAL